LGQKEAHMGSKSGSSWAVAAKGVVGGCVGVVTGAPPPPPPPPPPQL
jgi:hypothetical protein